MKKDISVPYSISDRSGRTSGLSGPQGEGRKDDGGFFKNIFKNPVQNVPLCVKNEMDKKKEHPCAKKLFNFAPGAKRKMFGAERNSLV